MLESLHIENIAVIERADIEFGAGLNVLTGETGAGKSIVIDSIQAVLGGRTSRELVRAGEKTAMVSAVFSPHEAEAWLKENDLYAGEDELILQRKVSAEGKSGCRINAMPATAAQLRELGGMLLDIHGQNDGRQLMDEGRHREYLDRFGGLEPDISAYREIYREYRKCLKEISKLKMDKEEKEQLLDSLQAKIQELSEAGLNPGEYEELLKSRDLMKNAGRLAEAAQEVFDILYSRESSAITMTGEAVQILSRVSESASEVLEAEKTITEAGYLLEDAAERLRDFKGSLDFSPHEYDEVERRISLLQKLFRRYGGEEQELLGQLELARERLSEIEFSDDRLIKLRAELSELREKTRQAAKELSGKRRQAATNLKKRITRELKELSMPSVRFEAELSPVQRKPGFDINGCDEVCFLMSANAGEEPGRISRIASGGELSRIMLAMKSVFAENDSVETLIFDEIDTGVSGIAAQRVGEKLGAISRKKQVLCVTHLPQIAAMADHHYVIEKSERSGRTYTDVLALNAEGQVRELARLHGGENITENTLLSAREQLLAAVEFKDGRA